MSKEKNMGIANYFKTHFRGDHSLARSFWINMFLPAMFLRVVIGAIATTNTRADDFVVAVGLLVAGSILYFWGVIGGYRACSKNGGAWSSVLMVITVLWFISGVIGVLSSFGKVLMV
jgi:amino acid permease